ncbi:dihydrolipoamide acetyltransferase family protein [Mangrovitalea sediminis]|uniref:dihydrolipoamide acetyltransferase family protein n=1 Tax=Mangrovitalea sediminis TaxID=1982043 RepID=UPI000BE62812|nr:2-oxo acid dehydrogenase subunit E2 [Mangrovitalea sediminis]
MSDSAILNAQDTDVGSRTVDILVPVEQEGTQATVRTWLKQSGDAVLKDEPVVELETDKVVVEVPAPCDGILEIVLAENCEAEPGAILGHVVTGQVAPQTTAAKKPEATPAQPQTVHAPQDELPEHEMRLSPAVRRLIAEFNLDPTALTGTGRNGRLTRADVVAAIDEGPAPTVARDESPARVPASPQPGPRADGSGPNAPRIARQVPHSSMRRRIAEHMTHSVTTAPHVTAVFEADFGAIIAHRNNHKAAFAGKGVNLTFTAYFVMASIAAMEVAPEVNSRWYDDYLELYDDINIGVGAALGDKGLIVPVIHRSQTLSLLGIASRLQEMTEAARNGTLKPADVQGGTFTISNHGVSGSLLATPVIINQPQSAILGIGALEKRVVVKEIDGVDSFQARPRAYVSLTIDHRVIDGSQTNAWLKRFVEVIENWPLEG